MDEEIDTGVLEKVVDRAVMGLMEHFDSVQVIVTKHIPDGKDTRTVAYHKGDGNWYARCASVAEWLTKQRRHLEKDVDEEREDRDDA